jgi:DNA uptake protein ComE-like DNA-binding protein
VVPVPVLARAGRILPPVPTPAERRALLFVAAVAVLGTTVRGAAAIRGPRGTPSDRLALADQIARVDSAIATGGRRPVRAATVPRDSGDGRSPRQRAVSANADDGARPREPVDLDRADSAALDALSGIGPALAARIVEDRAANGPFGSLDALQRVRGIGPALAKRLEPAVTFSTSGRRSSSEPPPARVSPRPIRP